MRDDFVVYNTPAPIITPVFTITILFNTITTVFITITTVFITITTVFITITTVFTTTTTTDFTTTTTTDFTNTTTIDKQYECSFGTNKSRLGYAPNRAFTTCTPLVIRTILKNPSIQNCCGHTPAVFTSTKLTDISTIITPTVVATTSITLTVIVATATTPTIPTDALSPNPNATVATITR
jgi:hypothetical protein